MLRSPKKREPHWITAGKEALRKQKEEERRRLDKLPPAIKEYIEEIQEAIRIMKKDIEKLKEAVLVVDEGANVYAILNS